MERQLSLVQDSQKDETVSGAVVRAVAEAQGISPLDVHPPLATVIDPDALDQVVASMARWSDEPSGVVEFQYYDYIISVTDRGEVFVAERESIDWSLPER